jgi:hypothetical protein
MIADLQGNEEGLLTDIAIIDEEYVFFYVMLLLL